MAGLLHDVRSVARSLARHPLGTLAAVLALAIGLGTTITVFSVLRGVLFVPLPYAHPESLVVLWETNQERGWGEERMAPAKLEALRASGLFEEVSASAPADVALTGAGDPLQVHVQRVLPDFFRTLGISTPRGRFFDPSEVVPGADHVVVLSDALWHRRFGADPKVLGATVHLDREPYRVIGVARENVGPYAEADLWIPLALTNWHSRVARFLQVIGRLPPATKVDTVRPELEALSASLDRQYPDTDRGWSLRVAGARDQLVAEAKPALWTLFAAVVLVLFIACANVATLLLARGAARQQELAVRQALGAGRGHLARLVVLEALWFAVLGGVLGLLLAAGAVQSVVSVVPARFPGIGRISVDGGIVLFALATAGIAALLTALWPAVRSWGTEVRTALQGTMTSGLGASGERGTRFAGGRLVVGQIAVACVLLVGAGLMIESLANLQRTRLGFDPAGLVAAPLSLPWSAYDSRKAITSFHRDLLDRLEQHPALRESATTSRLPLSGEPSQFRFLIEGDTRRTTAEQPTGDYQVVSPRYFQVMRIPLLAGRAFDGKEETGVVVVNQATARRYWPERPFDPRNPSATGPLGERISIEGPDGPWLTVVGVVGDVRRRGPERPPEPAFYAPFDQDPGPWMTVVARSRAGDAVPVDVIRQMVWSVDPDLPVPEVFRLEDRYAELLQRPRFILGLLTAFGVIALALATVGLYGTVAYTTGLRTREIAIRLSLGADRESVVRQVVRCALGPALLGAGLGLVASLALTALLQSLLYGVHGASIAVLAAVLLLIVATSLAAAAFPAIRSSKVDPAGILHH